MGWASFLSNRRNDRNDCRLEEGRPGIRGHALEPGGFLSGLRLSPEEPHWRLGIHRICVPWFPVSAALALRDAGEKHDALEYGIWSVWQNGSPWEEAGLVSAIRERVRSADLVLCRIPGGLGRGC